MQVVYFIHFDRMKTSMSVCFVKPYNYKISHPLKRRGSKWQMLLILQQPVERGAADNWIQSKFNMLKQDQSKYNSLSFKQFFHNEHPHTSPLTPGAPMILKGEGIKGNTKFLFQDILECFFWTWLVVTEPYPCHFEEVPQEKFRGFPNTRDDWEIFKPTVVKNSEKILQH